MNTAFFAPLLWTEGGSDLRAQTKYPSVQTQNVMTATQTMEISGKALINKETTLKEELILDKFKEPSLPATEDRLLVIDKFGKVKAVGETTLQPGPTLPVKLFPYWRLDGNALGAGSSLVNPFIGSTDASDVVFKSANTERIRITAGGMVKITGPLNVSGLTTLANTTINGNATIAGNTSINGNASFSGNISTPGYFKSGNSIYISGLNSTNGQNYIHSSDGQIIFTGGTPAIPKWDDIKVGIGMEAFSTPEIEGTRLSVNGHIKVNDKYDLLLRNGHNGIGWYGSPFGEGKTFADEANIDGTVLYGWNGGALGSKYYYEDPPGTIIHKEIIALRWDKMGSVGIGTTDPLAKLHIKHEGTAMRFQRTGFASYDIRQTFYSGLSFVKAANNQVVLHLADTGNVGIGTDNPLAKLDIRGRVQVQSDNYPGIKIINDNTGTYHKATVEFVNTDNGQQTGNLSQFLEVKPSGYSSFIMRRRIPDGTYFDYLVFDEEKNNIILNAVKSPIDPDVPYGDVIVNNGNALIMNGKIGIGLPTPADLTNPNPKTSLHIVSHGSSTAPTDETADIAKAGILLSSSYSGGVNYMPGLFWSNTNINTDKPSAGIWVNQTGSGTNLYLGTGNNDGITSTVVIDQDGKVGIGTINPQNKLEVCGTIKSKEWIVEPGSWCDFAFAPGYKKMQWEEKKKIYEAFGYLPYMDSGKEIELGGLKVAKNMKGMMLNLEEDRLDITELFERMAKLEAENKYLKNKVEMLEKK